MTSQDAPVETADQDGSGAVPEPSPAAALWRQLSCSCSRGRCEPMHDRKLSYSYSFSSAVPSLSPASSSSSRSYHVPMSNKSSCESIPVPELELALEKQSSISSSTSSYESFFQLEAADLERIPDFAPAATATQAPAVQTMMAAAQGQQQHGAVGYDPRRLPSSIFRAAQSTSPADVEWSVTSNDSLFSIQLSHSDDLGALCNQSDLYYDAAGGFHRLPSTGHDASCRLPAVSEMSAAGDTAGGGLCVAGDCARCSTVGKNRKSVRFAAAESVSVSGEIKHSAVFPALADALEEAGAPARATEKTPGGTVALGWCALRCCWPSVWCRGCDLRCGEYCRC